ncbi:MAG TPA: hypothetical protein VK928_07270, partial [Longimicrobiales bacterium]|nr:hypothetical protein [Longimicrobiales bacterium]
MSDHDRRENLPDPESAPPVTVPSGVEAGVPGDQATVASVEPMRPRTPPHALVLSAILPGAGHAIIGEWLRGLSLLLPWGGLLGLLYLAWERIAGLGAASMDDWVAVVTLLGLMLGLWGGALWDLAVRQRRAITPRDSQWAIAVRQFKRNRLAIAGLGIIIVLYLVALLAPLLAPYDPTAQADIARTGYLSPRAGNWLGTDRFGRDVLSRIIYGARISLAIGFIATIISITIGTMLGAIAGYFGGKVDMLV